MLVIAFSICGNLTVLKLDRYMKYYGVKTRSNFISLIIGSISCLGVIMVGSFQASILKLKLFIIIS